MRSSNVAEQRRTSLREAVERHGADDWQARGAVFWARRGEQGPGALLGGDFASTVSSQVPVVRCGRGPCEACSTPDLSACTLKRGFGHVWGTGASIEPHALSISSACPKLEALESSTEQPLTCFSQVASCCCKSQEHAETEQLHCRLHPGAGRGRRPAAPPLCVVPCARSVFGLKKPGCPSLEQHWHSPTRWPLFYLLAVFTTPYSAP